MRNRAKCKLCNDIIESFHPTDIVECKCGEIAVDKGLGLGCAAKDWRNFIRVDDDGKEYEVKPQKSDIVFDEDFYKDAEKLSAPDGPTREELLEMLADMIKTYENLPQNAMTQPITHYDLLSVLLLMSSILRSSCD